jgi:hypothetical protein
LCDENYVYLEGICQEKSDAFEFKDFFEDETTPDIAYEDVECINGVYKCDQIDIVSLCFEGKWILYQICNGDTICLEGFCAKHENCDPGKVNGCYSADSQYVCSKTGLGYVPKQCPQGEMCIEDGKCKAVECVPDYGECVDKTHFKTCMSDGSGFGEPEECPEGLQCVGGSCYSLCESEIKVTSYLGCEYWTVDLHNYDETKYGAYLNAQPVPHAVAIGNPSPYPVTIKFETQAPVTLAFNQADLTINSGDVKTYTMPVMSLETSSLNNLSVRITSNHPITVQQFNPLNNVGICSNGGSLLLPVNGLGTEYVILSYGTVSLPPGTNDTPYNGYFTVVAVSKGETEVNIIKPPADIQEGKGVIKILKDSTYKFKLQQYDVLNLEAAPDKSMKTMPDLTGTIVQSDKPVVVFGGHECLELGGGCCCDHVEEQLLPLHALGKKYHAVKARPRNPYGDVGLEVDFWRVVSGADNNKIQTIPSIAGLDGITLQKGQMKEVKTGESFEIIADGPVIVGQYLISQEATVEVIGDPSMILAVPIEQYRNDYSILTPSKFAEDWITIIRPKDEKILLDSYPVDETLFDPFGSGEYEYAWVTMTDGLHHLSAGKGFGVIEYGFDSVVSYGLPAGMNIIKPQ